MDYSFRLAARVLLYAPSHRQDSTYHGLCYTSRGTRNSSMGPPHEGSIRRPIAPMSERSTSELHPAPCIAGRNEHSDKLKRSILTNLRKCDTNFDEPLFAAMWCWWRVSRWPRRCCAPAAAADRTASASPGATARTRGPSRGRRMTFYLMMHVTHFI